MSRPFIVCAVQLGSLEGETIVAALDVVTTTVARAVEAGAQLVVLPEIWSPGYFAFDSYADASQHAGRIREHLSSLASTHDIHLHGGSFVEEDDGDYFNTSVLFDPNGDPVGQYRKIHLFGFGSREPEVLTPGDSPTVAETELGRVGMVVCYDLRYPELFRHMVDHGAEMVLVASAWPHPRLDAWLTLNRARAIESQVHVIAANGVGPTQSGPSLCGHSVIVDPWGTPIAQGGDDPTLVMSLIDLDAPSESRERFRQLADRRLVSPTGPELSFRRPGERPLTMEVDRAAIAGYTGRDTAAVAKYVEKLAEEGIKPPESIPMVFEVGADRVVSHDVIDVTGEETCGEVEFVLLVTDDGVHVTVGSDHTDRSLEQDSIALSKQVVPKVVAREAWRLDEVADHWDQLKLTATVGTEARAYQETGVDFFLEPANILEIVNAGTGTVVFCGTVSSLQGGFDFDPVFSGRLHDPVLDRSIEFTYRSRPMEAK
jgi:predicted amidohydrolase